VNIPAVHPIVPIVDILKTEDALILNSELLMKGARLLDDLRRVTSTDSQQREEEKRGRKTKGSAEHRKDLVPAASDRDAGCCRLR
jgi:hypothetical protein